MQYVHNTMGIQERAALEAAKLGVGELDTSTERMAANIDYIAMMVDVEIPTMADTEEEGDHNVV